MYTFTDMTKSTVHKYKSQTSDSSPIIINDSMSQTIISETDDPLLLSPLSPVGNEFSQKELEGGYDFEHSSNKQHTYFHLYLLYSLLTSLIRSFSIIS